MEYLLDTNICIHYFKGEYELQKKIEKIGYHHIAISEITLAELIYGAERSQKVEKNLQVVEDFADKVQIIPILAQSKFMEKKKQG